MTDAVPDRSRLAFRPEMLAFYIAMLIPPLLGYVFGTAWVGIISAVVVIVSFLLLRYWMRR
jgi:hypothetical protein